MFREVRRRGAYVMFHSDGWIEPIIPDLIEVGVDVLNPIQPECMDPVRLKKLYGDKLCFDGTIGVQSTLPHGTTEEVVSEVRHRIRTCGPTGLILGPTHAMQPDVPVPNMLALYETARNMPLGSW
jgi:uroporphyrinogen-III decarboxylase